MALVSFTASASALDSKTGKVSTLPSPPTPRNLPLGVGVGERLVLLGGVTGRGVVPAEVDVFDRKRGQWFAGAPWPSVRGNVAAANVGGKVCLYGGQVPGGDGAPLPSADCFDAHRNAWSTQKPMPVPIKGGTAQGAEGQAAIWGVGADQRPVMLWHDTTSDSYTRFAGPQMPSVYDPSTMDSSGVYILSGRNKAQSAKDRPRFASYLLLHASRASRDIESLPAPPSTPWEPELAAHDGKLYVLSFGHAPTVQIYDIASRAWSSGAEPPSLLEDGSRMRRVGSRLVVMATPTSLSTKLSGNTWIYDTERNSWSKGERYAPPTQNLGVVLSEGVGEVCVSIAYHTKAGPAQAQQPTSAPPLPAEAPPSAAPRASSSAPAPGASSSAPAPGASSSAPAPGASSSAPMPGASAAPAEFNFEDADVPVDASKVGPAGAPEQVKRLRGLYVAGSGALEKCFAEATRDSKLKPAYRVGTLATVKAGGEVSVSTSGDAPALLMSCVQGAMKGWAFPKSDAGYSVKRVLVFKGK